MHASSILNPFRSPALTTRQPSSIVMAQSEIPKNFEAFFLKFLKKLLGYLDGLFC